MVNLTHKLNQNEKKILLEILLVGIGLFLSAFFSMAETVFVTVNKIQLEVQLKRTIRGAKSAVGFLDKPESFLSTTLVGTDMANILTTSFATVILIGYMPSWAALIVTSIVILIFGEILPKTIGRETAGVTVTKIAPLLKVTQFILYPVIALIQLLGKFSFFRKEGESEIQQAFSKDDLRVLFSHVEEQGYMEEREGRIISNLLSFNEVTAGEAMIPRTQIAAIPSGLSRSEIIEDFSKTHHSKLLVYEETIDKMMGVILLKDLFDMATDKPPKIREVKFIPESKPADEVMEEMQQEKQSVVVVVDEYGGTAGILTIEDIVEEIFGEMDFSLQSDSTPYRKLPNGDIIINGEAELDLLREELGIEFPNGEYETLAGLLTFHTGKIPAKGDKVLIGNKVYEIIRVTPRAVKKVILKKST